MPVSDAMVRSALLVLDRLIALLPRNTNPKLLALSETAPVIEIAPPAAPMAEVPPKVIDPA